MSEKLTNAPRRFYPLVNEEITPADPELQAGDGYKLTSEDDRIVEGILEILPDGYGIIYQQK